MQPDNQLVAFLYCIIYYISFSLLVNSLQPNLFLWKTLISITPSVAYLFIQILCN